MSDPCETGGRPLASTIQQPEGSTQHQQQQQSLRRKRRKDSQSSDERIAGSKSTSSRPPPSRKEASFGPRTGSSRGDTSTITTTMQRSTSPTKMSPELTQVNYTRTGRISKAKKGLKVHNCECGRSYTRAEHLRRHQKNHQQDALRCEFPECGKTFYRPDLLQRHQERHAELGKDSRRASLYSQGTTGDASPQVSAPVTLPATMVATLSQGPPPYFSSQAVTPMPESAPTPSHMKQQRAPFPRTNSVTIPVQVDSLQTGIAWNDPFNGSPNYSSSSGYASPVPGAPGATGDFANMFANPPYGPGSNRTRTSSNASFIEPWGFPSRSPTSATSTMAYTWTSNDKSPAPANLAYMTTTSFPMTSVPMSAGADPMSGFGHFGPKSMAQRDEEEQAYLFPEQSFGMGQFAHTYPFEQYLDNYWRLFHPSFPIVHRATFDGMNDSPMLRAAMIAVGGQYSNDPSAKRKLRILHDRCMKLLDQRDLHVMTEPERLCDYQALFLVEVLSQYRARRAAKTLSNRFEGLYQRFCQDFRMVNTQIIENLNALVQSENVTYEHWTQWIELSSAQRLLQCCYILEYQQATLLARNPKPSLIQFSGVDLPFPAHSSMWDAASPTDWAIAAQQYAHLPAYVYEATTDLNVAPFDHFQSTLIIASYYNHFSNPAPYLSTPSFPAIDHLLDSSPMTKHQLLTAKLLQVTPVRALLAVSGESWILSEKVPSAQAFSSLKSTLRTWTSGLWAPATDIHGQTARDALKIAIELLQLAIITPTNNPHLELGADMGLYYSALVIWAITVAANTRINTPQSQATPLRFPSHSPLPSGRNSGHYPSTPTHLSASTSQASPSPNTSHPPAGLFAAHQNSPVSGPTSNSMLHSDITVTSVNFLSHALLELGFLGIVPQWPRDVAQWQQGCAALLRCVKMRLRNSSFDVALTLGQTSTITGRGNDGHGELLDGVIGVLEKIIGRGWEGWGV